MAKIIDIQTHKEKLPIEADQNLVPLLEGLMEMVDHSGSKPITGFRGGVYTPLDLSTMVSSIQYDGVEIGYRLHLGRLEGYKCIPDPHIMSREVLIHFEQSLKSIPDEQKGPIVLACFDVFLQNQQGPVEMETFCKGNIKRRNSNTHDCLRFTQEFAGLFLVKTDTAKTHIKIDDDIERLLE